tara:strand:+ start:342382 stop:343800 length:1419 start_codon:yes stop_codon:yes gene_type:complete
LKPISLLKRPSTYARVLAISATTLGLCAGIAITGCATDSSKNTSMNQARTEISQDRLASHIESFEYVWNSVKEKHWDPDLNGVDWDQAHADLLPKIQQAESDSEARQVINELLSRLGQSHFGIIPSTSYNRLEEESTAHQNDAPDHDQSSDEPGWAGMNVRLIDGQFLVTKVVPDSPAANAGIKTGWIVDSIRGRSMDSLIEVTREIEGVMRPETQAGLIAQSRLGGDAGETISMTFSDEHNTMREVSVTLDPSPGVMAGIGELPESPIEVEATTLDNGIGYFRLSLFMSPGTVLPTYQQFIEDHKDAPGIVIDMRGNYGGIILMAPGMINWLIDEKGLMGTMKMRDPVRGPFNIPLMLNPRKNHYTGKVAVLIDELSISNAEILSAGIKDIGRGKIFGTQTAGLALPSTVERLPNGDGFQYAFADYTTSGGYSLEAQGTIPDFPIQYTRQGLLSGHDEVLDAATNWIQNAE